MKILKRLQKFYAVETHIPGAARSFGVTMYKRDLTDITFNEIQVDLWWWTVLVSLPSVPLTRPTTSTEG